MARLKIHGREQCVTVLVTFEVATESGPVPYMILTRNDPRYREWYNSSSDGNLKVGGWKFAGGYADELSDAELAEFPVDTSDASWATMPNTLDERQRAFIAANGLKELSEEINLGQASSAGNGLSGIFANAKYEYLCREPKGDKDIYHLHLNLRTLNAEQFEALKEYVITPKDDCIQTCIVPVSKVHRNDSSMEFAPGDGFFKNKEIFNVPEFFRAVGRWAEHSEHRLQPAWLRELQQKHRQNEALSGLFGVDEGSLAPDLKVGFDLGNGETLSENQWFMAAVGKINNVTREGQITPSESRVHD